MSKILSIAIPTLNRAEYLKFTIDHFVPQIEPLADKVELVICSNACNDNTSDLVNEYIKRYSFIRFNDCKNRVQIGDSFKRTVEFTEGKYLILWGDDDIPAPFLINYLLHLIETNQGVELYYFNRLVGYEDGCPIKSLTVNDNSYIQNTKYYEDSTTFIKENFLGATFMTSILFSKGIWERGLKFDTSTHYGYEFMGILYYGNKGNGIMYGCFPLFIQRKVASRAWGTDWPKYALLGLPNMSKDLEKEGLFDDGLNVWQSQYNSFILYCYILMSAATNKKKYKPYCKSFASYQNGVLRKILAYAIIYCVPGYIYNLSRKLLFTFKR